MSRPKRAASKKVSYAEADSSSNDERASDDEAPRRHAPPKRAATAAAALPRVSVVVLDIEGTTTPLAFVRTTLFGYVRAELGAFVARHWDSLASVKEAAAHYNARDAASLEAAILGAMDADSKGASSASFAPPLTLRLPAPALKNVQADIMEGGWASGALQADVYADAVAAIRRWHEQGVRVAIYSSGAIAAQKALFGHVGNGVGSLLPLIDAHFDPTTVGPKTEASAYEKIQAHYAGQSLLFASDNPREVVAAHAAGLHAVLIDRPGNEALPAKPPASVFRTFDALFSEYTFV